MKKYELTDITITHKNKILHRIKAIKDFGNIKAGTLGGFVESEDNLSHYGNCWLFDDSKVYDTAAVSRNATLYSNAEVFGNAEITGDSIIADNSKIFGDARIFGYASVRQKAQVFDHVYVRDAIIEGNAIVCDNVVIFGDTIIGHNAVVKNMSDYLVFKNCVSSGRYFTWTKSNDMWQVGCFFGTGEELIKKAFEDSFKKGIFYQSTVNYVENLKKLHIL